MNILDDIVRNKEQELAELKKLLSFGALKKEAFASRTERRPFVELFGRGPVLIAEVKPKSPSAGTLIERSPLDIADLYAESTVDVISVLTDAKYFGGSIELLKEVRSRVPQTILRKDFIIDEYQVYETLLSGADVFLLIAAILNKEEITRFAALGKSLGLGILVEVHDDADLKKALAAGAEVIGINNRDLTTMQTDLSVTEKLMPHIPKNIPVVSESGIETEGDARRVRECGARGILVGTSILRSLDPRAKIAELKNALV